MKETEIKKNMIKIMAHLALQLYLSKAVNQPFFRKSKSQVIFFFLIPST